MAPSRSSTRSSTSSGAGHLTVWGWQVLKAARAPALICHCEERQRRGNLDEAGTRVDEPPLLR